MPWAIRAYQTPVFDGLWAPGINVGLFDPLSRRRAHASTDDATEKRVGTARRRALAHLQTTISCQFILSTEPHPGPPEDGTRSPGSWLPLTPILIGAGIRLVGWVELFAKPINHKPNPIILRSEALMGFGKAREERALPLPILQIAPLS